MSVANDLAAIYADSALTVPVVYGGFNARGFLDWSDAPQQDTAGEIVLVSQRTLTIAAGALGTISNNTAITVDGTAYTIHDIRRVNDGNEVQLVLV